MTHEERAIDFAELWCQRAEAGATATTLSYLLSEQFRAVAEDATLAERGRIAANLSKLTRP